MFEDNLSQQLRALGTSYFQAIAFSDHVVEAATDIRSGKGSKNK